LPGLCPKLIGTWERGGKKLDLNKLYGQWKLIYEDREKTDGLDCMTTKMVPYSKDNSTIVHVLNGQIIVDHDIPEAANYFHEDYASPVFYDDETVFVFNHPKRDNLGAIMSVEDLGGFEDQFAQASKRYGLEPLTDEKRNTMSSEEIKTHDGRLEQLDALN
jgi:hypothetical protein